MHVHQLSLSCRSLTNSVFHSCFLSLPVRVHYIPILPFSVLSCPVLSSLQSSLQSRFPPTHHRSTNNHHRSIITHIIIIIIMSAPPPPDPPPPADFDIDLAVAVADNCPPVLLPPSPSSPHPPAAYHHHPVPYPVIPTAAAPTPSTNNDLQQQHEQQHPTHWTHISHMAAHVLADRHMHSQHHTGDLAGHNRLLARWLDRTRYELDQLGHENDRLKRDNHLLLGVTLSQQQHQLQLQQLHQHQQDQVEMARLHGVGQNGSSSGDVNNNNNNNGVDYDVDVDVIDNVVHDNNNNSHSNHRHHHHHHHVNNVQHDTVAVTASHYNINHDNNNNNNYFRAVDHHKQIAHRHTAPAPAALTTTTTTNNSSTPSKAEFRLFQRVQSRCGNLENRIVQLEAVIKKNSKAEIASTLAVLVNKTKMDLKQRLDSQVQSAADRLRNLLGEQGIVVSSGGAGLVQQQQHENGGVLVDNGWGIVNNSIPVAVPPRGGAVGTSCSGSGCGSGGPQRYVHQQAMSNVAGAQFYPAQQQQQQQKKGGHEMTMGSMCPAVGIKKKKKNKKRK